MHIFYKSIELSCHSATCFVILPCCSIYDASACAVVIRSKSLSFKLIRQWNKQKKLFLNVWYLTSIPTNVFLLSESTITPSPYIPSPLTMHRLWNFCPQTPLEVAEALSTELLLEELKWQALGELKEYKKCFLQPWST